MSGSPNLSFALLLVISLLVIGILLVELRRRKQANDALLEATQVSASTGDAFFRSLTEHLSRLLKTDYASIGEVCGSGKRLRTVALVSGGSLVENVEYDLAGTPCEHVLKTSKCLVKDGVQSRFPLNDVTPAMGLRSYLGVALLDGAGAPCGVLSVMSRKPLKNVRTAEATLNIFAHRASAEMERRRSERALQESESRNRAILKTFPDMMFLHDRNGVILDYYTADNTDLFVPPEQFLGKNLQEVLPPDVSAALMRGVEQAAASKEPAVIEYSLELLGQTRFFEARMVDMDRERVLTIVRNVTSRKSVEMALDESRRFTQRIAETIPSVLFVYDLEQRRNIYVNRQSASVLGYTDEEVLSMGDRFLMQTMHPDDLARLSSLGTEYSQSKDGDVFEHVFRFRHKSGEWRWIHRYATIFARTPDGRPKQILGTGTDITSLKRAEEDLRSLSSQLLNIQDEERRRIARELHDGTAQNLFAVSMSLASLRKRSGLPKFAQDMLDECSRMCDESLKELRTISYLLHPPMLDHTGLADAVKWFVEGFTRRSGIQVELEIAQGIGRLVPAIERDLFRIVQEGLANVSRHSGSTKAIVRMEQRGDELVLLIRDFGKGMSASAAEVSEGADHRGVGITGMRERLRHVGGHLDIHSTSQGTSLIATVPVRLDSTLPPLGTWGR
jgi:PAS domain S-box-containing protein